MKISKLPQSSDAKLKHSWLYVGFTLESYSYLFLIQTWKQNLPIAIDTKN